MTHLFDRGRHHRRSIRLRGYDYAAPGTYFVTIDTQERVCLFGEISRGRMHLNAAGIAAQTVWAAIPVHFPRVRLDAFVVMPNHVHGVIIIAGTTADDADASASGHADASASGHADASASGRGDASASRHADASASGHGDACVGATHASPLRSRGRCAHGPPRHSIGAIVGSYKSAVSRHINQLRGTRSGVVWQRNYYERIIRDYPSLLRVRAYIYANPHNWKGRG